MNYAIRKSMLALCLTPVTALWLVSTAAQAQTAMPAAASASAPTAGTHNSSTGGSPDMKQSLKAGMDDMQKMQMTGNTDKDFAMLMKMHHQQALDMAEMELAHGKSPELKGMASKIVSEQKKEIGQFERWLARQK